MKKLITNIELNNKYSFQDSAIEIKTNIIKGMIDFSISSCSHVASRATKDRIKSAFNFFSLKFPYGNIKVSLSTSITSGDYSYLDLAIALSLLENQGLLEIDKDCLIIGKFGLEGSLIELDNPYRIINFAKAQGIKKVIIPWGNYYDIDIYDIDIYMARNLREVVEHLHDRKILNKYIGKETPSKDIAYSLNDISDQPVLKRALIVAIAGKHNILIKGPIGSGKSMAMEAIEQILPDLTEIEFSRITDIKLRMKSIDLPQKTAYLTPLNFDLSYTQMFGGVRNIGKISELSYGYGVLDEFNIFTKKVLDKLKFVSEEKIPGTDLLESPRNFALIALMNPCPCGYYGTHTKCTCTNAQISRHNAKIDKALLDRFAIKININMPRTITSNKSDLDIEAVKRDINRAKAMQFNRYGSIDYSNGNIDSTQINKYILLDDKIIEFLDNLAFKKNLSRRAINNIIKVSQTIADLEGQEKISIEYLYEAVNYCI